MRAGDLSKRAYGVASRALRRDWDRLAVVDFREVEAGRLAAKYGLRGFDAIHLSSAVTVASAPAGPDVLFSSFDAALNRAAARERLQVLASP
jgi:predicted nucleic acid-binding protein